ncbi:hypothetical protein VDGL01_02780 [Verticillium dahliae]
MPSVLFSSDESNPNPPPVASEADDPRLHSASTVSASKGFFGFVFGSVNGRSCAKSAAFIRALARKATCERVDRYYCAAQVHAATSGYPAPGSAAATTAVPEGRPLDAQPAAREGIGVEGVRLAHDGLFEGRQPRSRHKNTGAPKPRESDDDVPRMNE